MLEIELLYFEVCPSWTRAWAALGQALADERIDAALRARLVAETNASDRDGGQGAPDPGPRGGLPPEAT